MILHGNVMDTSHVQQEENAITRSTIQLSNALLRVLDILEPNVVRQGRNIEVSIDDTLHVRGDEARLRQVLLNVLSNALKYTPIKTNIALRAERIDTPVIHMHVPSSSTLHDAPIVLLSISDQGDGIALEDQERLFTKFVRLPNALKSKQRGSGLELYWCRQLVEAMGGAI